MSTPPSCRSGRTRVESTREQLTQRARRQAGGTHAPRHATPPTPSLSVSARLVHRCARACAPEHSSPPLSYCALTRQPGGTRSTAQAPAGGSPGESPARGARVCECVIVRPRLGWRRRRRQSAGAHTRPRSKCGACHRRLGGAATRASGRRGSGPLAFFITIFFTTCEIER